MSEARRIAATGGGPAGHPPVDGAAEEAIMRLAANCGTGRSISPEDAARALAAAEAGGRDWHALLAPVRQAATRLALAGRIDILRKGKPVAPDGVRGVVRLRLHRPAGTP